MENETPGVSTPDTSNFLNWVEIKNFKSIKDLRLDCKRVNIFIGKPNVGKSNILEGLGLLGMQSYDKLSDASVRYKDLKQLFHNNDWRKSIIVGTEKHRFDLEKKAVGDGADYIYSITTRSNGGLLEESVNVTSPLLADRYDLLRDGRVVKSHSNSKVQSSVKKYEFANVDTFVSLFSDTLSSPNGSNLFEVIDQSDELKNEFGKLFQQQGLDFVLSRDDQSIELQRKSGFYVIQYPYFSIADTFRRYMFYVTAIESNKNSVIIFEEPEVHSFPPYVKAMAQRIAYSEQNQFFIATHSPYLLQTLIDELDESELAVYITYYKDYQTQVRQLTAEELEEARDLSIDLFYNLSRYEPNA
ncbi:AAA family ATPase [Spirosoma montaniterrae]|uniref:ATPase n=1 Tax=Spirosoma montaniterrae TaxID=1178516 RepID=A0A1P9WWJ2_9BACT|nr:AAA family ATPase [Spirosoma montaniterrae]AQG79741.1 ATPase [Spirosoma montaniterrae]